MRFILLLIVFVYLCSSHPWIETSPLSQNETNKRFTKIMIPVKNFNYHPGVYFQEDVFISPYFVLTDVDFSYELCSETEQRVKKDLPALFNNTLVTNPCRNYFCSGAMPFYLRKGINSTTNATHLSVQTYCTQCEQTRTESFSIQDAMSGSCPWYDVSKCGAQNQTDRLCMMFYPMSSMDTKIISYFWNYESYMISVDGGIWFLIGYFHYVSRLIYIFMSFIGIMMIFFLYFIPESILNVIRITKQQDEFFHERILYNINIRNTIFILIMVGSIVMFCGSIVSFAQDNSVGLTTTGAVTYIQLGLTLFAFTLIIIQWKHISEANSIHLQEFSAVNKILIVLSFVFFFIWGGLLVGSYIASSLKAPFADYVYAAILFGVSIIFGILGLIVIVVGLILTRKYLGGHLCDMQNIETFQMYRLKFTQIMIITSITLFVFVYIAFYNGLTLWSSRDILSIRFYYLYRSQLAFVTQFLSWCLIFSIVNFERVRNGYCCGKKVEGEDN